MIDGLKLTLTGEEIRTLLLERIRSHETRARTWQHEVERRPKDQTEDEPLLPIHMCEHEADRHGWRAEVLTFIREHLDPSEVYRLGPADLAFGELMPEQPGSVEQDDYEPRCRRPRHRHRFDRLRTLN